MLAHTHDIAPLTFGQKSRMAPRHVHLLVNRRTRGCGLSCKRCTRLGKHPRVTLGAAADHHGVATCFHKHARGVFALANIAVADNGNVNRLLHARDDAPIRRPLVHLLGIASMNGNGIGARLLHTLGKLGSKLLTQRPAAAKLHRNGHAHRCLKRHDNLRSQHRILHQRRTIAF